MWYDSWSPKYSNTNTSVNDESSRSSYSKPASTLATNLTQTLQNMRIPSLNITAATMESGHTKYGAVNKSTAMFSITAPGVCPVPSLAGA